jgi:hypothetical protein
MSYVPVLGQIARQRVMAQPEPLRSFILESLEILAANPTAISHRSESGTPGQSVEFYFDREAGVSMWVTVIFLYGADEQTLYIEHVDVEFGA